MPQEFCTVRSIPKPFTMPLAGSTTTTFSLRAPAKIMWDDGTVDAWVPEGFTVTSAYDSATAVDTFNFVWLIVAEKGALTNAFLVKEVDYANIDTVLGPGHAWAAIYRILGTDYEEFQQAGVSGNGMPAGIKGDVLYHNGTTWVVLHGTPGSLFYFDPITGLPIWINPTRGDLVRGESIAGVAQWRRYGINQGLQGNFLQNDRDNSGLPIWTFIPGVSGTIALQSDTSAKVLYLGAQAGMPFTGIPPVGWSDASFDDSGWQFGIISEVIPYNPPDHNYLAPIIWNSGSPQIWGEGLFRSSFNLAGVGLISTATLGITVDDAYNHLVINGHDLGSGGLDFPHNPPLHTYNVKPHLVAGKNVIAVWAKNDDDAGAGVSYQLTIS